jgi:recombination protein RecT
MDGNMTVTPAPQKMKFSAAITTKGYKALIANTLTEPKRQARFIAAITSAVGVNPALQDCDPRSIISGALLGESLGLSPSPQLGQYYLVPFKQKEKKDRYGNVIEPECSKATFIIGYKGMLQLAMRSGYYKKIVVLDIKAGELVGFDPLEESIECVLIEDPDEREKAPTVGYYAMFEYQNGFRKAIYWTQAKMLHHADRFSKAFSAKEYERLMKGEVPEKDMWKYSSFWYTSFDDMAKKTMLRQLLSHWGMLSPEMVQVFEADAHAIRDEGGELVPEIEIDGEEIVPEQPSENENVDLGSL